MYGTFALQLKIKEMLRFSLNARKFKQKLTNQ